MAFAGHSSLLREEARLKTFEKWPNRFVKPADLASAGFYYLQFTDKVQCVFCNGVVHNWKSGDIAMEDHKKHFPQCPFVRKLDVGNIPIKKQQSPTTVADCTTSSSLLKEEERLKTFEKWPNRFVKPAHLASAGFYYLQFTDKVKCVFCRGEVHNWKAGDIAMEDHKKHFPQCPFVRKLDVGNIPIREQGRPKESARHFVNEDIVESCMTDGEKSRILSRQQTDIGNGRGKTNTELKLKDENLQLKAEIRQLKKEIQQFKEMRLCKICLDKEAKKIFMPCSHLACCFICAVQLKDCPICRKPINNLMDVFFA